MIQTSQMKKNLMKLGLNQGHFVRMVSVWLGYCMAYHFI